MTEENVDLPLHTENEKNYELIALSWKIMGEFLCIKDRYGSLLHKSEISGLVMAGYWWLRVITGWLWVTPIF